MTLAVAPSDPRDPQALALLRASHALMQSLYRSEANHYLSVEALTAPHITFLTARKDGETIGTAALADMGDYAEVKSMFVTEAARGTGAGRALLAALEDTARARDIPLLRLETGTGLDAAHALYRSAGFTDCDAFGDYRPGPFSLFMEKPLT